MRKRQLILVAAVVLAVGGGFGLYWFQPWKLFTTTTANETLAVPPADQPPTHQPSAAPSATDGPTLLKQGAFITHEHPTNGSVRIVRLPDGTRKLEITGLDTSDGPDLRVWLTDREVVAGTAGWRVFDDGKWVELGRLRANKGNLVYPIPDALDLGEYRSVSIWCKRFAVSFGAAALT